MKEEASRGRPCVWLVIYTTAVRQLFKNVASIQVDVDGCLCIFACVRLFHWLVGRDGCKTKYVGR